MVFAFAYSFRVLRNAFVTIFWVPCFPVHRQLTTNFVNLIFYIMSDWIAIFFLLRVHDKNYGIKSIKEKKLSTTFEEVNAGTLTVSGSEYSVPTNGLLGAGQGDRTESIASSKYSDLNKVNIEGLLSPKNLSKKDNIKSKFDGSSVNQDDENDLQ